MFEVDHDHHGQEFTRFFSAGRSSMSAMDDKRAEAFRRHVWAVTMIDDEVPLPSSKTNRHSTQFVKDNIKRPSANRLKRRRKSFPVKPLQEQQPQNQCPDEKPTDPPQEKSREKAKEKPKEKVKEKSREKSRLKPRLKIIEKRQQESQEKPKEKPAEEEPKEKDTDKPLPVLPEPLKLSPPSYQEYYEKDSDAGFQPDLQVKYRERPQVQYKAYCPSYSLEENCETMKGPTITVQPVQPPFGPVAELYSDDVEDFLAGSRKNQLPRTTYPTSFSVVHELETPASNPAKATESLPTTTSSNKRKASNSSTASIARMYSNSTETMSLRSRQRTPSWGSKTSVDTNESTGWKPDYLTQQSLPIQTKSHTAPRVTYRQNELFGMMPSEVLGLVLSKLRDLHLEPDSISCSTCWMRDMCNLMVTSRKWYKTARVSLYEDIQLVGSDSPAHKKKYKLNQGARIMMLRRTLRANPYLASLVRVLKVPAPEQSGKGSNVNDYDDLVATLVMACPNLESLSGPTTTYDHTFKKLFHALSTRTKLKEMNWVIQVSPQQKQQQRVQSSTPQPGLIMPGELTRIQEVAFLDHHVNWQQLETLSINCYPGASLNPEGLVTSAIKHLPSLKHLHLCNVSRNGFNDNNLLALPALESLTLSHIPGITSNGLSSFATRSTSRSLRKLHLRHTPLTSLAALARILSNLRSLTSFALVQPSSPVMPEEDSFTLWMMPYLASSSLKKLHWDITAHALSVNNAADDILARSIVAGGFPELTTLRVHNDPDGIFQDLCLPKERMDIPSDRLRSVELPGDMPNMTPVSSNSPISPTRYGLFKTTSNTSIASLRTPQSPTPNLPYSICTNLHASRLAAQARLEAARSRPRFTVNVIDEDGTTTETYAMAGFLGTFGSGIHYHLMPDANSVDEKGGLPDVRDLDNDGGESLVDGREGCSGRWNTRAGVVADRKEKETWYHTERGRWTKPTM